MPMDPLGLHHNQDMMSSHETLESMLVGTKAGESKLVDNKKPAEALKCPRCDSSNTKFCYYNNYSLTQPRYFCKSCRRYWTKGGTLRNVPVGEGCRKNKRSSSKIKTIHHQDHDHLHHSQSPLHITPNPLLLSYDSTDVSLAFATLQNGQLLGFDHDHIPMLSTYPNNPHGSSFINTSLQNVYYGGDNFENVGKMIMSDQEMGNLPYEALMSGGVRTSSDETATALTVASVKQEGCNVGGDGGASEAADGNSGVLCGYDPWQIIDGGEDVGGGSSSNNFMGEVGRQSSWINGLHWHNGLLNTPLM